MIDVHLSNIDCDNLIYGMGQYHCLAKFDVATSDECMRCVFTRKLHEERNLYGRTTGEPNNTRSTLHT